MVIRDTFEDNPGLRELFKRKMLERARCVGLSEDRIDFGAQIDLKGTYHDNMRTFYREYPQLAQGSDYFRIKSIQPLSGAALEQSWRSYKDKNGHEHSTNLSTEQSRTAEAVMPELIVTYTLGSGSGMERRDAPKEPEPISATSILQAETSPAAEAHGELARLILDRVTVVAGEKVTRKILHQIGQEIGKATFNNSRDEILPNNLPGALNHALSIRGWGRVIGLHKTEHASSVTYVCTIEGNLFSHKRASTSPTCDVMRGIVSRWLESYVQRNAESVQTECVAHKAHLCVFRVTFRK